MKQRNRILWNIVLLSVVSALLLVLSGCNLGTNGSQPATLVPRASATPVPTLGYSGGAPDDSNVNAGGVGTPVENVGVTLYNMVEQIDADRLMAHVQVLEGFYTRHVNSTQTSASQGIGAAKNYIEEQFNLIGQQVPSNVSFTVQLLPFDLTYAGVDTRQYNVMAYLQGYEPGAGVLVIGAHYDSIGADFNSGTAYAPGANDNGTGVAGLLEIARVMSQKPHRASIIFVAFSAEEVGRRGSEAFVDWAQGRGLDMLGMINIDSIGNSNNRSGRTDESLRIFSCQEESWCNSFNNSSRLMARSVEFLGFAHSANLSMRVESSADRADRYGDHFSFAEAGYPAIRFINTMEEWGNGSTQDTIEYVERDFFRKSVQSILVVASALADGPQPPRNIALRQTDSGTPMLVWEPVQGATGYIITLRYAGSERYDQQIGIEDPNQTSLVWDRFPEYAGISVAARGADGIIGRLSPEYTLQPG